MAIYESSIPGRLQQSLIICTDTPLIHIDNLQPILEGNAHFFYMVLSQSCNLSRAHEEDEKNNPLPMGSVLLCPLIDYKGIKDVTGDIDKEKLKILKIDSSKTLRKFLDAKTKDALYLIRASKEHQLPETIADFRFVFGCDFNKVKEATFVAKLSSPYGEHMAQYAFNYMNRIALPCE